jgi:hypothetical protein
LGWVESIGRQGRILGFRLYHIIFFHRLASHKLPGPPISLRSLFWVELVEMVLIDSVHPLPGTDGTKFGGAGCSPFVNKPFVDSYISSHLSLSNIKITAKRRTIALFAQESEEYYPAPRIDSRVIVSCNFRSNLELAISSLIRFTAVSPTSTTLYPLNRPQHQPRSQNGTYNRRSHKSLRSEFPEQRKCSCRSIPLRCCWRWRRGIRKGEGENEEFGEEYSSEKYGWEGP